MEDLALSEVKKEKKERRKLTRRETGHGTQRRKKSSQKNKQPNNFDDLKSKNKLRLSTSTSLPSLASILENMEEQIPSETKESENTSPSTEPSKKNDSSKGSSFMRKASMASNKAPNSLTRAAALDLSSFKQLKKSKFIPALPQKRLYQRTVKISTDYEAKDSTELSLKEGEEVKLRGVPEFGWCEGEINGKVGWFPINVSKELETLIDDTANEIKVDHSSIIGRKQRNTIIVEKYLASRPNPSTLHDKNIIPSIDNNNDKIAALQYEMEKQKKAEILTNHLIGRGLNRTHNSDNEIHPKTSFFDMSESCVTETNYLYESDDDDEITIDSGIEEQAISLFTEKPKKAIDMLIQHKIVQSDAKAIADYLFSNTKIDKAAMGDYLSEKNDFNFQVLDCFLSNLNFKSLEFDESLRKFLLTFKLPGEAQKIDRLMEGFARRYFSQYGGNLFANQDTAYILSFSLIMLNTDLHNPSIKKKMTPEEFVKNQRGINDGKDLPKVFLEDLYQRIKEEKIQMEDVLYPNALKRGYLSREKYSKKYQKVWCILDVATHSFYCFKSETEIKPAQIYDISNLVVERQQFKLKTQKQKLYPISLLFGEERVKFFASSQRIWVDWLSCLNEAISLNSQIKNNNNRSNDTPTPISNSINSGINNNNHNNNNNELDKSSKKKK